MIDRHDRRRDHLQARQGPTWVARLVSRGALALYAVVLLAGISGWLLWPWSKADTTDLASLVDRLDGMALVYPRQGSDVEPFFIDRYEVTNSDYAVFLRETGYRPDDARRTGPRVFLTGFLSVDPPTYKDEVRDHPVVAVSIQDAEAYAGWAGKSLPQRDQWWVAADARSTPSSDPSRSLYYSNCLETGIKATTRVGTFESGKSDNPSIISPAVYDLYGNVWEWSSTRADPMPPGLVASQNEPQRWWWSGTSGPLPHLALGVSFRNSIARRSRLRADFEQEIDAGNRRDDVGFRCVVGDAKGYVRRLVEAMSTAPEAQREAARDHLMPMGEPLSRLVDQVRFDALVAEDSHTYLGGSDRVHVLKDGRLLVLTAYGDLSLIDPTTWEEIDRREDVGDVQFSSVADTDLDGVEELYFGVRKQSDEGRGLLYQVVVKDFFHLRLARPGEVEVVPLLAAPALADELWRWAAADLSGVRPLVDRLLDRLLDRGALGGVAGLDQRLCRYDLTRSGFVERYSVELPLSIRGAVRDGSDVLFVPGMLWVRYGDHQEPILMDACWLSARTGRVVARGILPGRFAAVEILGDDALVLTRSGHVLRLSESDGELQAVQEDRFGRLAGGTALELVGGPARDEVTLLRVEERSTSSRGKDDNSELDADSNEAQAGLSASVLRLRADGRRSESATVRVARGDRARIEVEPVTGATMLLPDPYSLIVLDRELETRGAHADTRNRFVDDLRRPIGGHFLPGRKRPQLAVSSGLTGLVILDPDTGEELDRLRAVDQVLLGWRRLAAPAGARVDSILTVVQRRSALALQFQDAAWFREAGVLATAVRVSIRQ